MKNCYLYPSQGFPNNAMEMIENGGDVEIKIKGKHRIKALEKQLPYLLSKTPDQSPFIETLLRLVLLSDFYAIYGVAVEVGKYEISYKYEHNELMLINFSRSSTRAENQK